MAIRFHRPARRRPDAEDAAGSMFGEWGAAIAVVALASLASLGAVGVASAPARLEAPATTPADPSPELLAAIAPAESALDAVGEAFAFLCADPVLLAIELDPDCETGVITIGDDRFGGFGSPELTPESQEDLRAAIPIYLDRLRARPAIWNHLEAIEIRGHADPRAVRTPYTTNLVGSQQRPLGLLLFLVGENGLGEEDRADIERLAVVSGASFSRPPASCPERSRECYAEWRRVEIRPVLSEALRREDWSRTVESVRRRAERLRAEAEAAAQAR